MDMALDFIQDINGSESAEKCAKESEHIRNKKKNFDRFNVEN